MIVTASATGLFRTILILIGVFVLLRFLGQFMIAKRNMEAERELLARQRKFEDEKRRSTQNWGKTSVLKEQASIDAEDIDYEDLDKA